MLHPDYQYEPRLVSAMAGMISSGVYDVVIGSRILRRWSIAGRYAHLEVPGESCTDRHGESDAGCQTIGIPHRISRLLQDVLQSIPWQKNSDDFIFDNELLAQVIIGKFRLGEISVPTKYFPEASSINFPRSLRYGFGVIRVSLLGLLARTGMYRHRLFRHGS